MGRFGVQKGVPGVTFFRCSNGYPKTIVFGHPWRPRGDRLAKLPPQNGAILGPPGGARSGGGNHEKRVAVVNFFGPEGPVQVSKRDP